jgi:hypothetical protein
MPTLPRRALPPHIETICDGWHSSEQSEMYKFGTFKDFDPYGLLKEIQVRINELYKFNLGLELRNIFLKELFLLRRYVMNIVEDEEEKK